LHCIVVSTGDAQLRRIVAQRLEASPYRCTLRGVVVDDESVAPQIEKGVALLGGEPIEADIGPRGTLEQSATSPEMSAARRSAC